MCRHIVGGDATKLKTVVDCRISKKYLGSKLARSTMKSPFHAHAVLVSLDRLGFVT